MVVVWGRTRRAAAGRRARCSTPAPQVGGRLRHGALRVAELQPAGAQNAAAALVAGRRIAEARFGAGAAVSA
jgi:hypothetical protein